MAIRERTGRAKPWQVYWNNPFTGKRESASFETKAEAEKEDSLIKHRLRFERESFRQDEKETYEKALTLEAVYMMYLKEKQFTQRNLANQLSAFRPILRIIGQVKLDKIDTGLLAEVKDAMLQQTPTPATAHRRLTNLRALINWAAEKGYCDMPRFPKMPSIQYKRFVPPSAEELEAIMRVAPEHIRRVVILGAQCGVRVGSCELFGLSWQDVNLSQGVLRVHGAMKNINAPWREVPIRETLQPLFKDWQEADAVIGMDYLIHYNGKPVKSIKKAWSKALADAGIARHIRPYDLRHAFATELIAAGADIGTVAKLMGHSSPAMLFKHYQYVLDRQKRSAVECLPELVHVPNSMCPKEKAVTELQ